MTQLDHASRHAADIVERSNEALGRMHRAEERPGVHNDPSPSTPPPTPQPTHRPASSDQMRRLHVVIVNKDPAFLDAVRIMLQSNRYNVTSTNLVPSTCAMIAAAEPDALVIDLTIEQPEIWSLVEGLRTTAQTCHLPIIFTATDPTLLDHAQAQPWRVGGRYLFLKPFSVADLEDAIWSLIGPA